MSNRALGVGTRKLPGTRRLLNYGTNKINLSLVSEYPFIHWPSSASAAKCNFFNLSFEF